MIEQIMIFVLGFLVAGLIALLALPLLRQRARRLARRRVEMSLPLSVNEVLAERDRLRAEFAVEQCRLEQALETGVEKEAAALASLAHTELALFEEKARRTLAEQEAKAAESEALNLANQVAAASKSLYDAHWWLDVTERRAADLEAARDRLLRLEKDGREAYSALEVRVSEIEQKLAATQSDLAAAQSAYAQATRQIADLLTEVETLRERSEEAEQFGRLATQRGDEQEMRAEDLTRSLERMRLDFEGAQDEAVSLRRELTKAEARADVLRASLERQSEARRSMDSDLALRLLNAESQIASLKGALEEARREAAELRRVAGPRRRSGAAAERGETRPLKKASDHKTGDAPEQAPRSPESALDRPA